MLRARNLIIRIVLLYCALAAFMYAVQRQLLYVPTNVNPSPEAVGLNGVDVVEIPTPDGETVILWHAPAPDGRPTVLFFHGNGDEIANRSARLAAYQAAGFGAVFVSWRGYGGSSGAPSEAGLLLDAVTAYDWVLSQGVAPDHIALSGESLGTGVAVQLAAEREVCAVSLGAPFTAAVDVAARLYPWLPVRVLMKDPFRSVDHVGRIRAPILIQHGVEDDVVPFDMGERLATLTTAPTEFIAHPGEGHQVLYSPTSWRPEIAFFNHVFAPVRP